MVPILSMNPAPSFIRSTLCDAARWVVCFGRWRERWREIRLTDGLGRRIEAYYFFLPPAAASAAFFSSAVEEKRSVHQSHGVGWTFSALGIHTLPLLLAHDGSGIILALGEFGTGLGVLVLL